MQPRWSRAAKKKLKPVSVVAPSPLRPTDDAAAEQPRTGGGSVAGRRRSEWRGKSVGAPPRLYIRPAGAVFSQLIVRPLPVRLLVPFPVRFPNTYSTTLLTDGQLSNSSSSTTILIIDAIAPTNTRVFVVNRTLVFFFYSLVSANSINNSCSASFIDVTRENTFHTGIPETYAQKM